MASAIGRAGRRSVQPLQLRCLRLSSSQRQVHRPQRYHEEFQRSVRDPQAFWADKAKLLQWDRHPTKILSSETAPFYRWFEDGRLNMARLCLDRHVDAGHGSRTAVIHDCPAAGTVRQLSYAELRDQVAKFAAVLQNRCGVALGDRVVIYMPMCPEAIVAMLACARLGATHSVVFGGFAARELAVRIDDTQPKVVVCATHGLDGMRVLNYKELVDDALQRCKHKVLHTVVLRRDFSKHRQLRFASNQGAKAMMMRTRDMDWEDCMSVEPGMAEPVSVPSTHPLFILYTSGTTAQPKGTVRDTGGYAVALKYSMSAIYDMEPGETMCTMSDVGWIVGHTYIVYGPLLHGITSVMYEGKPVGTPDASAYWRLVSQHKVNSLFTAPTAVRAIKKEDPHGVGPSRYDLSSLRQCFVAGERADPSTVHWFETALKVPILDCWWMTESGWPMSANCIGLEGYAPVKYGSAHKPVPGWNVDVVDEEGLAVPPNAMGSIVCRLPLPPGSLTTLFKADDRYVASYLTQFPGCFATGDAGFKDEDGYLNIMSRIDDVINTAGHRLSTGQIEEALIGHPHVVEAAVVAMDDELKGHVPFGFVVLNNECKDDPKDVAAECVALVREMVGPVASFKHTLVVNRLPKTRTGKILRRNLRSLLCNETVAVPATIEDPAVIQEVEAAIKAWRAAAQGK